MKLFLDLELLNKGPKAPKAPAAAPAPAAPKATGSTVADIGTGEKTGKVAATAPTANVAKKPSARPTTKAATSVSPAASAGTPTAQAPAQATQTSGPKTQNIVCPLGEDECRKQGGTGKHRPDSPYYQKHAALAAKATTGAATPDPAASKKPKKGAAPPAVPGGDVEAVAGAKAPGGKKAKGKPGAVPAEGVVEEKPLTGAAAASVADVPEGLSERPVKDIPLEKPTGKDPAGKTKTAKVAPDPEFVQMHNQHMQEYNSGSRDQEHHKVIHAMTVAEHRRAAAEYRSAGHSDLAALHDQAGTSKPRLKDISGTKAHETIPEGERAYSSPYLEGYISHASRYLAGGPGGHPASTFSQIHSMTEADHNDMAIKLEAAGANSAAARHRRIGAMKKEFAPREKQMLEQKDLKSKAAAEAKAKKTSEGKKSEKFQVPNNPFSSEESAAASEGPKPHADDVRDVGSNALSHLVHNHDMPPEHKKDLLQQVLKLQDLHDRSGSPTDADKAAFEQIKGDLGHMGSAQHSGKKSMPGKRYLSQFEPHELDAHADLAESAGMGELATKYRNAAATKHEEANRERIKGTEKASQEKAKADAKEAKVKEKTTANEAKAQAKAAKQKDKEEAKAAKDATNAEKKRVASAPHLPGDHGEYTAHAQSQAGRLNDFLNSAADLEPHQRQRLESVHKIIDTHSKLSSPATPEQRRELSDALKVSQSHMDKAKYNQLGSSPEAVTKQPNKINTTGIHSAFSKWYGQGSAVAQSAAKDQTASHLISQIPHVAGAAVAGATHDMLNNPPQSETKTGKAGKAHGDMKSGDFESKQQGQAAASGTPAPQAAAQSQAAATSAPASSSGPSGPSNSAKVKARADRRSKFRGTSDADIEEHVKGDPSDHEAHSEYEERRTAREASDDDLAERVKNDPDDFHAHKEHERRQNAGSNTKRPSARAKKSFGDMFYLDLSKAGQGSNMGMDSDRSKNTKQDAGNTGGGSGFTADDPKVGADWHRDDPEDDEEGTQYAKSMLSDMQDLLRSMSSNLTAQLSPDVNTSTEAAFLQTQGYDPMEAKYNTKLLSKGLLRKKYDTWLLNRMEKSLSALWSNQ